MSNLLSLIDKITHFYKASTNSYLKVLGQVEYGGADEPEEDDLELYHKMVDAARQVSDADVADQILLIAEMYKKTLDVNGGFNLVSQGIDNLLNMLEMEDAEEQASVEDVLNEVSLDLRNRARTAPAKDDEAVVAALKSVRDQHYNPAMQDLREEFEPEVSPFEAGLEQYEEGATGVFDPTGGVGPEVGKTKGRGYHVETRSYKDWAKSFENERQRFEHELTAPELQLSRTGLEARRNTAARNNLRELVDILGQMVALTTQATQLETDLAAAPDPNKQQKLSEIRGALKQLQDRRVGLKKNLRNHQYTQQNKSLNEDLASARADKDRLLIQQRIRLNELMMSPDKGKDEEAKWLRVLINSISGGHSLSAEQIAKIEQKIREGAAKRIRATDLYRQKAEQVAALKGTKGPVKTKQERLEGRTKKNQYDFDTLALDGLIEHLTQRMATERIVVKQKVTDKMEAAKATILKPFMDDVAKAATKKDRPAFLKAVQVLKAKMREFKNQQIELMQFIRSVNTSRHFYNFRDRAKKIGEWLDSPLTPEQVSFIDDTIREGKRLLEYYKSLKIKPALPGAAEYTMRYAKPLEIIEKIVKNLEGLKYG